MLNYILDENTEYALRVLLYLMPYGNIAPLTEAAGYMQVPREKLRVVGSKLKTGELIKYVRGSYGGYMIAKDPAQITLYDIVICMVRPRSDSVQKESKAIADIFGESQKDYIDYLEKNSLNDLYIKINGIH